MSDIFGISVSALKAFQAAIATTSNNVANANTPGYDRQTVNLSEALPQANGTTTVGSGVVVSGISRAYSQAAATQLNTSQSSLGQLNGLQNYTNQIDNLVGTTGGGISTALQTYYSAWSDVANHPTSTASRQALLGAAQSLSSTFQSNSTQLNALSTDVNNRITTDVTQINSMASSIAALNTQIVVSTAQAGGQPPNELLDQRDTLVSNLSKLVNISTTAASGGALDVFVGTGQPLVLGATTNPLTTVPNEYNASQLDISNAASGNNTINATLTSGDLGGLLAARTQAINPALAQLGQIATAVSTTANAQQAAGLDLHGQAGGNIFSVATLQAYSSSKNSDAVTAAVTLTNVGALTSDSYILKAGAAGALTLTNAADGTTVPFTGTGTVADPLLVNGVSVVLSGAPANGDSFLISPTGQTASSLAVTLTDPSKLAAAGEISSSSLATNTGSATVTVPTVLNQNDAALKTPATIAFTSPTTYTINGAGSFTYADGGNIAANGWQVQISGTPASGDQFTVQANTGGSGDNRNALASANQQTTGVLNNGTTSITGAVSALITGIGSQAAQVNTAQTAQAAVNSNAIASVQSTSGVNLDEEAANLLQWQQAYQASAEALNIGNSLFASLLAAVNGT